MPHKSAYLYLFLSLFLSALNGMAQAVPGPPSPPMIILGEVLFDGQHVSRATIVEARIEGDTIASVEVDTSLGNATYRLEVRQNLRSLGEAMISIACGTYISNEPIEWLAGGVVKHDILFNTNIRLPPEIKNASATKDQNNWNTHCRYARVAQDDITPESIRYRIRWYAVTAADNEPDTPSQPPVLVHEKIVPYDQTEVDIVPEVGTWPDEIRNFSVLVTPILNNGEFGPSAFRKVNPVYEATEL